MGAEGTIGPAVRAELRRPGLSGGCGINEPGPIGAVAGGCGVGLTAGAACGISTFLADAALAGGLPAEEEVEVGGVAESEDFTDGFTGVALGRTADCAGADTDAGGADRDGALAGVRGAATCAFLAGAAAFLGAALLGATFGAGLLAAGFVLPASLPVALVTGLAAGLADFMDLAGVADLAGAFDWA